MLRCELVHLMTSTAQPPYRVSLEWSWHAVATDILQSIKAGIGLPPKHSNKHIVHGVRVDFSTNFHVIKSKATSWLRPPSAVGALVCSILSSAVLWMSKAFVLTRRRPNILSLSLASFHLEQDLLPRKMVQNTLARFRSSDLRPATPLSFSSSPTAEQARTTDDHGILP